MKTRPVRSPLALVLLSFVLLGGCSKDDPNPSTGGAAGSGGTAGTGGTGGTGGGVPTEATSCKGSPVSCTVDGKTESCCTTLSVPGGTFSMGRSSTGTDACPAGETCYPAEVPEHQATIAPFYLDRFEVTVGRFRKYVEQYDGTPPTSGSGAYPGVDGTGWQTVWGGLLPTTQANLKTELSTNVVELSTWTDAPGPNEDRPIMVSWALALAFCIWDGGRLPTEAEWEFAAAGGDENRLYPWGNTPYSGTQVVDCSQKVTCPPDFTSYDQCTFEGPCHDDGGKGYPRVGTAPAGAGKYGHLDLAGSVQEWTFSEFRDFTTAACTGCEVKPTTGDRTVRGGDSIWGLGDPAPTVKWRSAVRVRMGDDEKGPGFRCARDPVGP